MKKICKHCNLEYDESDVVCCECGRPLEMLGGGMSQAGGAQGPTPPGTHINQDNRIHKGDSISVGGDNVHAQNVDKRTVTSNTTNTTTNTTNNNYYQTIVDESRELVTCEISGKRVLKVDSYECPVCKRTVAAEYYVRQKRMCVECAEAAYGKDAGTGAGEKEGEKVMPPLMTPAAEPERPVFTPIKQKKDGKKKSYIAIGAAVAVVAVAAVLWVSGGNGAGPAPQTVAKENVEARPSQGAAQKDAAGPKVVPARPSQSATPPAAKEPAAEREATVGAKPASAKAKAEPSLLDRGIGAFEAKNYSTASILLEQAAAAGEAQAGYYLSCLYRDGAGVKRDVKRAFTYMKQAAEGGCAEAYYELAEMYRLGKGTEANRSQAKKWYERAVVESAPHADKAAKALSRYR